jgi:hypothetical protein
MVAAPERPPAGSRWLRPSGPQRGSAATSTRPAGSTHNEGMETEWHSRPATPIPLNGIYPPRGSMTLDQCENIQGQPSVRINTVGLGPTPVGMKCTSTPTTSTRSYS